MADDPVSVYVHQLQRRYAEFQRDQQIEFQQIGTDAFGRFFHEHFLLRDKKSFESLLRSMLTPPERDLLQTDPTFTQAWQIFVDLCWLKKKLKQYGIVVVVILLSLAGIVFAVWALPHVAGPKGR